MPALLWLIVFLSLHACNARHLVHRDKVGKDLYNPRKEVEHHHEWKSSFIEVNITKKDQDNMDDASKTKHKEPCMEEHHHEWKSSFIEVNITKKDQDNKDDASKTKHKEPCMEEHHLIKGKKSEASSSSQEVLQLTINLKEKCKKEERRKLGEELEKAKESANSNSMEDEDGEDIGVMDYVQPHRKPPIHNKEHSLKG